MFEKLGTMLGGIEPSAIGFILGILGLFTLIALLVWKHRGKRTTMPVSTSLTTKKTGGINAESKEEESKGEESEGKKESILGTGEYPCYAFADGCLQYTTIPERIGRLFVADPSMPVSGPAFLVVQNEGKGVMPFDPRDISFVVEKSPQWAYFAIHWEIVREVYPILKDWWQSVPMWLAIASTAIMFITVLITFD